MCYGNDTLLRVSAPASADTACMCHGNDTPLRVSAPASADTAYMGYGNDVRYGNGARLALWVESASEDCERQTSKHLTH